MFIRISYVLKSDPHNYHLKTFTGWDRADCHENIRKWEVSLGDALLEWHNTDRH